MRAAVRNLALLAWAVPMLRRPTGAREFVRALPTIYAVARLARATMGPWGLALTVGLAGLGWLIARNRRGRGGAPAYGYRATPTNLGRERIVPLPPSPPTTGCSRVHPSGRPVHDNSEREGA